MILEIVSSITGTTVGAFVGHINGFFAGRKVKAVDLTTLFPQTDVSHLWCLCGHSMSFHEDKTDECVFGGEPVDSKTVRQLNPFELSKLMESRRCSCVTFVGDPERNPKPKGELEL